MEIHQRSRTSPTKSKQIENSMARKTNRIIIQMCTLIAVRSNRKKRNLLKEDKFNTKRRFQPTSKSRSAVKALLQRREVPTNLLDTDPLNLISFSNSKNSTRPKVWR